MGSMNAARKRLREYLYKLSTCQTRAELMHEACAGVGTVIPFDQSAGIFNIRDRRFLEGVGKCDSCAGPYNSYYRTIVPAHPSYIIDWNEGHDSEFTVDFARPNGIYKCLWYRVPGYKIAVRTHRSRSSSQFDTTDLDNLKLINEYLNTLYARFDHEPDFHPASDSAEAFADKFRFLSRRETEVCSLLARHWNTAEIAAALFLSPRTVEKHVEGIFGKFDVRTREQLRWRLGVIPAMETESSQRPEMLRTRSDRKLNRRTSDRRAP